MKLLYNYIRELKSLGKPIIIMGDFNVIPHEIDCKSPQKWENDALFDKQPSQTGFVPLSSIGVKK